MRRKWILLLTLLAGIGVTSCRPPDPDNAVLTIAVIPKGTTHVYWQTVHAGAAKAAEELDVRIVWIGTAREDDRQQQIALVENQAHSRVNGIVLAPLDSMALRRPVRNAVAAGIPVVIIDSGLSDADEIQTSFIATDNREGGRIAGRQLAEALDGKGKVALLRYLPGSDSTAMREEGFLEAMAEFQHIEIVSQEQYAGATRAEAQQTSENLLMRFKDGSGKLAIDGVFCPNASSTYGMLQALRRQRLAGEVAFIGFDSDDPLVEGLRAGDINGLVVQNPFNMGYLGVKTMVQHLKGEAVESRIDTGVTFVKQEDLARPEIVQLLHLKE